MSGANWPGMTDQSMRSRSGSAISKDGAKNDQAAEHARMIDLRIITALPPSACTCSCFHSFISGDLINQVSQIDARRREVDARLLLQLLVGVRLGDAGDRADGTR